MSHLQVSRKAVPRCLVVLTAVAVSRPGMGFSQGPQRGDVQILPVITLRLEVDSTESASKRATYTPPPGWYIRSHSVDCTVRYGHSSYAVSTVPAGWAWTSERRINEVHRQLVGVAAKAHDAGVQARFTLNREDAVRKERESSCTHEALIVDATARGEGLFRGGGCIELTVTAELVYVGVDRPGTPPHCNESPR